MRHRNKGRKLGRSASHRRAMLRNLAASLILTERDAELEGNAPKVKGRVVTTLHKAKEVRPLVEKCITIARRSLEHQDQAEQFTTDAERGTDEWRAWRNSDEWQQWNAAIAPAVAARRRVFAMLRDKQAVQIVFGELAPRFRDRPGGYTRIVRLPKPRLGDNGIRALLEFVGVRDREAQVSERPEFAAEQPDAEPLEQPLPEEQQQPGDAEPQATESREGVEPQGDEPQGEEPKGERGA